MNFNNINNPNLISQFNQNNIPGILQNNNLLIMNYLNPIQNQLMNIPNINQIVPNGQNFTNITGQMNNLGINQINNNINNYKFKNQFKFNIIPKCLHSPLNHNQF